MIEVDIRQLIPDQIIGILENERFRESILDDIASSARAKWIRLAQVNLKSTAQSYIQGIQEVRAESGIRTIQLTGWLALAIELGLAPFDLRETILLNPNAKAKKPIWSKPGRSGGQVQIGWYANIPFRHGTPGTTGLVGAPMGSLYGPRGDKSRRQGYGLLTTEQSTEFGKQIYQEAKKLKTRKGRIGPAQMMEKDVERIYSGIGGKSHPLLRSHHKTSIYAGMRKERKPYVNKKTGKTTVQSQYITFRRISTENKTGWDHPGISARNFSNQVIEHIAKVTPSVIKNIISRATKES